MRCELCGKLFEGYGNNPWPLKGNFCCDECNKTVVIPARIALATVKEKNDEHL